MPTTLLNLEYLEPKLAMTGLPLVSFSGGVLAIAGTGDSDIITLDYDATQLTVVELNQSYLLKNITTINIATGAGDDTVQLSYVGTKKPKWLGVAVVVRAQEGNDVLRDAAGNAYFLGDDDVLTVSRKGDARLDGLKLTWFDNNVADETLRSTVKAQYADKVLSRGDMLALFGAADDDDILTAAEFTSLQAIVENKPLFRKLEDVLTLSNYVINGSVANAFFQQDTLGNLAVGSTGEQLERLVDKWFFGKDRPDAHDLDTDEEYQYREVSGTLFVNGVSYTDIRQGALGDCYLLAGLGAIAVHSSKPITSMFIVNGDGTYTVRFYNGATPYYITVDSQLPVSQADRLVFASAGERYDDPSNELWVPLVEKAYAQLAEFGWLDTGGDATNSYAAINAGWPGDVTGQATGKTVLDLLALDDPRVIAKAFASGRAVTFITPSQPVSPDVIGDHVYALVGYDARTREFILFNPWGLNNGSVPGIVTLTWEGVLQNCYAWDYGPKV